MTENKEDLYVAYTTQGGSKDFSDPLPLHLARAAAWWWSMINWRPDATTINFTTLWDTGIHPIDADGNIDEDTNVDFGDLDFPDIVEFSGYRCGIMIGCECDDMEEHYDLRDAFTYVEGEECFVEEMVSQELAHALKTWDDVLDWAKSVGNHYDVLIVAKDIQGEFPSERLRQHFKAVYFYTDDPSIRVVDLEATEAA